MKAIIYEKFGPPEVLHITDIPKPIPKENEVLIKIHATTVHRGDSRMRGLDLPIPLWQKLMARLFLGIKGPRRKILGMELAGIVEEIGLNVHKFKVGDKVFASTINSNFGAYAEYKCLSVDAIISLMPKNLSFEESATIPNSGFTALGIIRLANLQKGDKVLIYGASGSVGTFAIQFAKYYSAIVTGVCGTASLDMVKHLGADTVLDYTQTDLSSLNEKFDVVLDAVGKMPALMKKNLLKPDGIFLDVHKASDKIKDKQNMVITELKEFYENTHYKPVIDRSYSFNEIVEAHRYVDQGHKHGNVVIKVI